MNEIKDCPHKDGGDFDGVFILPHDGDGLMQKTTLDCGLFVWECPECHWTEEIPPTHEMLPVFFTQYENAVWEICFMGKLKTVKVPILLNLLTLRHEPAMYTIPQYMTIRADFLQGLINLQESEMWLKKYAHVLCPVHDYHLPFKAALR